MSSELTPPTVTESILAMGTPQESYTLSVRLHHACNSVEIQLAPSATGDIVVKDSAGNEVTRFRCSDRTYRGRSGDTVVKPPPEPKARPRSTMWPEIDEPNPK